MTTERGEGQWGLEYTDSNGEKQKEWFLNRSLRDEAVAIVKIIAGNTNVKPIKRKLDK